jgi:hypothetical protein
MFRFQVCLIVEENEGTETVRNAFIHSAFPKKGIPSGYICPNLNKYVMQYPGGVA